MSVVLASDQDFATIIEKNEKVIVKYYASWCGQCRLFSSKFKRLSGDARFEGIQFLDVDAEENPGARKAAGVNNLPYFAVFQNGKLLDGTETSKEEKVVELLEKFN